MSEADTLEALAFEILGVPIGSSQENIKLAYTRECERWQFCVIL